MEEIWKPIPNYEGLYEVSNMGRVKSLGKTVLRKGVYVHYHGKIISQNIVKGYMQVMLSKNSKRVNTKVHRLVAIAFIPNDDPVNKTTVNHKNEDKLDNRVENLEWMSIADNTNYGTRNKRASVKLKTLFRTPEHCANISKAKKGKPVPQQVLNAATLANSKAVTQYDIVGNKIATYTSAAEASRQTGFGKNSIRACCRGVYKQAYGFVWKYVEK